MPTDPTTSANAEPSIEELEQQIAALTEQVNAKRREAPSHEVPDYVLSAISGEVRLSQLFAGHESLLVIHNMGQRCRYCTLWADGINGFLPHLESVMGVALLSKDPPEVQRRFANARGWRFQLASHLGGDYIREQTTMQGEANMPGAVLYERRNDRIFRKNSVVFGPGDMFCSAWNLLALAGLGGDNWTPQFSYWQMPSRLDDGGADVLPVQLLED